MGNSHNTNLRKSCTSFEGTNTATRACFGDSSRVDMIHYKENKNTEVWSAVYEIGGDGLQGGITAIESSGTCSTFVNDEQDYSIETTIISCDSFNSDDFYILQMKKMKYSNIAFKVAMAHFYVTKTVGLYVEATICRNKDRGFVVEVNGPFIYQSVYLRKIIDEIRLTGIWSPGGEPSTETNGDSGSSLHGEKAVVGQVVKNASNKGLINASGYTNGSLNNSIFYTIM
ncbi:unnamed protein product [Vicia faba]|uniref:Uncharacterized protein n=1 Tax=Vicia faba TaxID=3906 RepID=A0AAV0YYC0_VICFA|nr:unnamed protein product [Vicia faba]